MKTKIIAITGLSGSGKSTIADKLSKLLNIPKLVTTTTRPIRPGEIDGVDYNFINNNIFIEKINNGDIICPESFVVANGETWSYGLPTDKFKNNDKVIIVLTPKGVDDLKNVGFNVYSIYVHVEEEERLTRIYNRKDNQSNDEIKRRNIEDKLKFKYFNPDSIITNDSLDSCLRIASNIIKEI